MNKDKNIKVSVVCLVYNHGKYLRDCLEGIVRQKTDFSFEAIIHDDCSTDDSVEIINEYAVKYPTIIRPILEEVNLYSKHNGSLRRAVDKEVKGEYVALCEGDDFWTDPIKLQMQVDFLDLHPDYTLCFHNVHIIIESNRRQFVKIYSHLKTGDYSANEIIYKWTVPTCSAVMRSECYIERPYDRNFVVGDNVIWMNCCHYGKAYCINEKMATYRRRKDGWTLSSYGNNEKKLLTCNRYILHLDLLSKYFPGIAVDGIREKKIEYWARIAILEMGMLKPQFVKTMRNGGRLFGMSFYRSLLGQLITKIIIRIKVVYNKLKR